jgi:endoglucanase
MNVPVKNNILTLPSRGLKFFSHGWKFSGFSRKTSGVASLVGIVASLLSCSGKDSEPAPELVVSTETLDFAAASATKALHVKANTAWTITVSDAWCAASPASGGGGGTAKVDVLAAANTLTEERRATLTVTAGTQSKTVAVTQAAFVALPPEPPEPEEPLPYIPPDNTGMSRDAVPLVAEMGYGWNIGNSLEAYNGTVPSETAWGNPKVSQRLIDSVKAAGFNAIRIPCAWNGYIENRDTYKIKALWLARVKEVVDYCVDNGMYAILNIHWDGGWLEENPTYAAQAEVNRQQEALWRQIAVYFRSYDEHLLFAGTNEVHAGYGAPTAENIDVQLSYNQTFVNAVRATGGRNAWRNLVVQAYNTNIDHAVTYMEMPTDNVPNRLIVEVHYYDPWDFCGEAGNSFKYLWGSAFSGAGKSLYGQEDFVDRQLGQMKTHFVDKNIPVILGEYGANIRTTSLANDRQRSDNRTSRNSYLRYVTAAAKSAGIAPFYWDNGFIGDKSMALFNRSTGARVYPDAIDAIMNR